MKFGDRVRVTGGFFEGQLGTLIDRKFHAGDGSYSYVVRIVTTGGVAHDMTIPGANLEKLGD